MPDGEHLPCVMISTVHSGSPQSYDRADQTDAASSERVAIWQRMSSRSPLSSKAMRQTSVVCDAEGVCLNGRISAAAAKMEGTNPVTWFVRRGYLSWHYRFEGL